MDREFYVYEHIRSDTGAVFYVGKGRERRAWRIQERNMRHRRVVAKLRKNGGDVSVSILADRLSEEFSFALEKKRIAYWRSVGIELANLTEGGEGSVGYTPTPETLVKMAEAQKGKRRTPETRARMSAAATGRRHTEETRKKLSEIGKGKTLSEKAKRKLAAASSRPERLKALSKVHEKNRGRKHSVESRAKMTASLKAGWATPEGEQRRKALSERRSKPVRCLNDGKTYPSGAIAAEALGLSKPRVSLVCQGKVRAAKGYRFEFVE